jgi:hypothetical protein
VRHDMLKHGTRFRWWTVWAMVVIAVMGAGGGRAWASEARVPAQQDQRCFPETGQCISGRFREYWEQNGGLAVFGFPISAVMGQEADDGMFETQWFERNSFELHPENAAPYDVLLGRLGDDRLRQLGRDWQTFPKGTQRADCAWFAQTSHNVCEPFRSYWEGNGLQDPALNAYGKSLALFGLPLSEAATETNASGFTVVTQWFERARFECYPDNPPPYQVQLGLLGTEVRQNPAILAPGAPVPCTISPAPQPAPQPTPQPTPVPDPGPAPVAVDCSATPANVPNFPVQITLIDKRAEIVYLRNVSDAPVNLEGWTMCSITGGQEHTGIGGVLAPGETGSYRYLGPGSIWNNSDPDHGALYDARGRPISYR